MIRHPIQLIPQRAEFGCWEAAASMIKGSGPMCLETGEAVADVWNGIGATDENIKKFADYQGFVFQPSKMTYSLEGIQGLLTRGPIWVGGAVPTGHAYVLAGYDGDRLLVFDPWPPHVGRIHWISYGAWINKYPFGMVWLLTPR